MKKNKERKLEYKSGFKPIDPSHFKPYEVVVNSRYNDQRAFDEAFRSFKSMIQKEKILSLYKEKQYYEKPSIKKRRKRREAQERLFTAELKQKLIKSGEWEKRMKRKQNKKQAKMKKESEDE